MALGRRCATVRRCVPCIEKPMSRWVVILMGKYVIVVESGSDVTPELCERYGIVRGPMHVTIGDETVEDGSIDPLEIYSRCNEFGVMPKTRRDHFASRVFRSHDLLTSVLQDCS